MATTRAWHMEVHRLIEVSVWEITVAAKSEADAHRIALGKAQENDGHASRFGDLGLTYVTRTKKRPQP